MTAAGTAGHGDELGAYGDLAALGAVVVKSLSPDPWPGNPAPRLRPLSVGMINSVGLQGPGLARWIAEDLPPLAASGAKVVVSVWGRSIEDFARAGELLAEDLRLAHQSLCEITGEFSSDDLLGKIFSRLCIGK